MATTDSPRTPERRRPETWLIWTTAGSVVAVIIAVVLIVSSIPTVSATATDIEPGIDKRTATLLELDPLTDVKVTAPAFSLTDQDGKPMSLADYRGMPVVLSFNDDKCTDLCTLLAQDVRTADTDLGPAAKKIAFVSINANPYLPIIVFGEAVGRRARPRARGQLALRHRNTLDPSEPRPGVRRSRRPRRRR